jgi:hypothetical protein
MDDNRFDRLTRVLGSGATRRGVLGALAVFAGLEASAAAKPRRAGGKPDKPKGPDKPQKPEKVLVCHKPGTPAQQTLSIASPAVAAHLRHGDHLGACCPADHVSCNGRCCPPPPQGGKARCCPDGSCGCAETCCGDNCFYDNLGGNAPAIEFCCVAPDWGVCPTRAGSETCCPYDPDVPCGCADAPGIAGSYRRR